MNYDPKARRDTPLALKLKQRIRTAGPISVRAYMAACLGDPEHGYYPTRHAIGRDGDFITAPEISQIFGELIGLWTAVVWQQMGSPKDLALVELGPGRGTLMADALRAARLVPGFLASVRLGLVEISAPLRGEQLRAISPSGVTPIWAPDLSALSNSLAGIPAIVIGNEFLDCVPAPQWIYSAGDWHERGVGLDTGGELAFVTLPASDVGLPPPSPALGQANDADIIATPAYLEALRHLTFWPRVAALFIDYGYLATATGDSLQAVRAHGYEHPLTSPGEADLTLHVDFEALRREAIGDLGLAADGPVAQAAFLGALGMTARASKLMAANPASAPAIETAVARLMAPQGMGGRFKAIGLRSADLPPLPGF